MNLERAQTQKNWTKIMVCTLSLPLIPLGVFNGKILAEISFAPERLTDGKLFFYYSFPPTIFIALSIGLTVACACLVVRMNKYFDRSLKDEVCRIKTIFLVFTVTYLTRATANFVVPRLHVSYLAYELIFDLGDIFWDVIPLTIVMIFHLKRIKPVEDDSNDSLLEDRNSQSARSMHLLDNSMLEDDPEFAEILIMN